MAEHNSDVAVGRLESIRESKNWCYSTRSSAERTVRPERLDCNTIDEGSGDGVQSSWGMLLGAERLNEEDVHIFTSTAWVLGG